MKAHCTPISTASCRPRRRGASTRTSARRRAPAAGRPPPPATATGVPQAAPGLARVAPRGALAAPPRAPAATFGFTLDSARAVLGQDPVVVPGAPIRAVRRDRMMGYAA